MSNKEWKLSDPSKETVWQCLKHTTTLAGEGRLDQAIEVTRNQISNNPDYPLLNLSLGMLLGDVGHYQDACEAFRRELEIAPRSRDAAWRLASAYSRLGLTAKSIEAYELALNIDPCCVQALYGLGNAHVRNKDYHAAIEHYRDAIFLFPELDQSDFICDEEGSNSLAATIHYNLGMACMFTGDTEESIESFENARKAKPQGSMVQLVDHYLDLLSESDEDLDLIDWETIELPIELL